MGRKTAEITITDEGRDKGKKFLLTEMPATQGEKWAIRTLLAMGRSGAEIPDDIVQSGFAGLAVLGVRALTGLSMYDAEPLLDEMFGCVQIVEDHVTRAPTEDDIEEVLTRTKLREEVLSLHLNFSLKERVLTLISAMRALASASTSISPEPSEPLSPAA